MREILNLSLSVVIFFYPEITNFFSNTIFSIFEHSFSYPNSEDIQKCQFYFFQNEHYVLTITPERKRVIRLFEIQEKLKSSFQFEKNENKYLKSQLQYFTSILHGKNNRIVGFHSLIVQFFSSFLIFVVDCGVICYYFYNAALMGLKFLFQI